MDFDPKKVARQTHPNWRYPAAECETVWDIYRSAMVVLASDYDDLLARFQKLDSEVEGENGLRASKAAGWAIAGARARVINELNEKLAKLDAAARLALDDCCDLICTDAGHALEDALGLERN